jgi:hypothetical protein
MMSRRTKQSAATASNSTQAGIHHIVIDSENKDATNDKVDRLQNCVTFRIRALIRTQSHMRTQVLLLVSTVAVLSAILLQLYAYIFEKQGPLDHVTSKIIWEPYYGRSCPAFSSANDILITHNHNTKMDNSFAKALADKVTWDCTSATGSDIPFPRITMMGARGKDENNTFSKWKDIIWNSVDKDKFVDGWQQHMPRFQRINTLKISNQYALSGGALRQTETVINYWILLLLQLGWIINFCVVV